MNLKIEVLSKEHDKLICDFDCTAEDSAIRCFKSAKRKKLLGHSEDLNNFIKNEALNEQEQGLNTTHLLIIDDVLVGYISLCADNLRVSLGEQSDLNLLYYNIPAIKIARMAVQNNLQTMKYGELLVKFAVHISNSIRQIGVGVKFITVDCYEHRTSYYQKYGFVENEIQDDDRLPHHPKSFRLDIDEFLDKLTT